MTRRQALLLLDVTIVIVVLANVIAVALWIGYLTRQ